ncbi:DELLA protein RGL1 [Physcomitrium patens]|uniref:Uncharacterized protein n=1 Tax=Physcomitrium patens TaxID=3218 RepID=A0A2K1K9W4_PHYPA|nr:DELLA protein RGL1-like [Physcomitrium patens]PNR50567.1 hypothetical protein PHYPA_009753 [Physcomitrium patens]|eukprot:XP_024380933.1 DELLA protein RGL1-like [Physcomitrella patens]
MAATHVVSKKRSPTIFSEVATATCKRWKSEAAWHHVEEMAPEPPPIQDFDLKVKTSCLKMVQPEPTSVLDLQASPGRSCSSSTSLSSGTDSPHSISTDSPNFSTTVQQVEPVDIASWVDCMALPEFEDCDRHLEEVLKSDIDFASTDLDFGFELTSLDHCSVVTEHGYSVSLLSEFLGDPDENLLLPESFHDAKRLQELDDSLSSMLSEVRSSGSDSGSSVPTTVELARLVESLPCSDLRRHGGVDTKHHHHHSRSESWGSTSKLQTLQHPEDSGLQLVHMLLACAEAIEKSDFNKAKPILDQLLRSSDPYGDPMQRIALYFGEALTDHLAGVVSPSETHLLSDSKLAYQAFYKVLPFAKFSHVTANQTIYEAVVRSQNVHVVDLDIQLGLQWPCFIQSLAMRPGGAPHLRISAIGTNAENLQTTKRRLSEFAEALKVPFEFTPVLSSLENLTAAMLDIRSEEDLAINCSQVLHTLSGEEAVLDKLLSMFHNLKPNVVTLLEAEANHNGASFIARFVEALHYYCALFDSLEGALGRDSADRYHIESTALAAEIKEIVAFKGNRRRVRHVRSETWRGLFAKAGFLSMAFSSYTVQQAQMLLEVLTSKPMQQANATMPYKLSQESTSLILGWQETPVIGVSAWTC